MPYTSYEGSRKGQASLFPQGPSSPVLGLYAPFVISMSNAGTIMSDGWAEMGKEWLNFMNGRIHEDLLLPKQYAECRNAQEVMEVSSEFMRAAAEAYRQEWTRLAELSSAATNKAFNAFQRSMAAEQGNGKAKNLL
jgi:hypothetical protein